MSSSNAIDNTGRNCVQLSSSLREPKPSPHGEVEGASIKTTSSKHVGTTVRADTLEKHNLSPLGARSFIFPQRHESPEGNPEVRRTWPTGTISGRVERPVSSSVDVPDAGCVSPPGHLHANKWAQIIIRARQRQILGESDNISPPCSSEDAGSEVQAELPTSAVDSDLKLPSSKFVEMWFSKRRPPKLDPDRAAEVEAGVTTRNDSEAKDFTEEKVSQKPRLFVKTFGAKDKKQLSLGRVLAKKDEKVTDEDLEFKKQCRLELEKRLSECGFGIHAQVKERKIREKKAREHKRHKNTVFDAASQTDIEYDTQEKDTSSNSKEFGVSTTSETNGAYIVSGPEIGTKADNLHDSSCKETVFDNQSSTSKANSLPENLTRGITKTSPSHRESIERISVASLQQQPPAAEFEPPARRTRSLLDSFRDFTCKSFWKRAQRPLELKEPSTASNSDLTININVSNVDGTASKSSESDGQGLKTSPQQCTEESKATVLKQNAVVRGNVLRSVVFYQNRFIVMDHSKSRTRKTGDVDKKQNTENNSERSISTSGKESVPENDSSTRKEREAPENESSVKVKTFNDGDCKEAPSANNRLKGSQSYSGVESGQALLSLPGAADTRSCLAVDVSSSNCLKSESDIELDLYYSRVQNLTLESGRLTSSEGTQPESQSGHFGLDPGFNKSVSDYQNGPQEFIEMDKNPQRRKEEYVETNIQDSEGLKGIDLPLDCHGNKGQSKQYTAKDRGSKHNQVEGFLDFEASDKKGGSRSTAEFFLDEQNEKMKPKIHSKDRVYSYSGTGKRSRDCYTRQNYHEEAETGIENELFSSLQPTRETKHTTPSEIKRYSEDYEERGRNSRVSGTKSLDRKGLREGITESKYKTRFSSGELGEGDTIKTERATDISKHWKQIRLGCRSSDNAQEETNHHRHYSYDPDGNEIQANRKTKLRSRDDRERSPIFTKYTHQRKFNSEENFLEPRHSSRRENRNVQFRDDKQIISEIYVHELSPREKHSQRHKEMELEGWNDYSNSVNHKNRGRRSLSPKLSEVFDQTLEAEVLSNQNRRVKNFYSSGVSRNTNTRNCKHLREDLIDYPGDFRDLRGSNHRDHRGSNIQTLNHPQRASRWKESDEAIKTRTSYHDDLDMEHSGSLYATSGEIPASQSIESRRTAKISSTSSTSPGHEKYQPRNRESHLRYKEYGIPGKDDRLSYMDIQPYEEELSPDHEQYQPSIRDYQPRHKNHKQSEKEYQPSQREYEPSQRDYHLSHFDKRTRSTEPSRRRHTEKS